MMVVVRLVLLLFSAVGAALVLLPSLRDVVLGHAARESLARVQILAAVLAGEQQATYVMGGGFLALAVLVIVWELVARARERRAPLVIRPGQKPTARLAGRLMAAKRFPEAADMYRRLGHIPGLVDALAKSGKVLEAAEIMVADDHIRDAAVLLEEATPPAALQRSAELWLGLGEKERAVAAAQRAAMAYASKGDAHASVELLLRLGEVEAARQFLEPAAEAYARLGKHGRAAEMFERFGDDARAAAAFEYESTQLPGEKERRAAALRAAKLHGKLNNAAGCGRCLEMAGMHERALEIYLSGKAWVEAATLLTAMGQQERATQVLVQNGLGSHAVAQLESQGQTRQAADVALSVGDPLKAAELFEQIGDTEGAYKAHLAGGAFEVAAELALQLQRHEEAASIWERSGSYRRAAEAYEKLANRAKAAEMFAKAGENVGAARNLLQASKPKDAAAVLLGQTSAEALDLQVETARALVKLGDLPTAAQLLKSAVDLRPPDKTVQAAMELSQLMEALGDAASALAYAQLAAAGKPDHTEALARVQSLSIRINADQIRSAYESAVARQAATGTNSQQQRYVTEAEIGRGAMGLVYRARDTVLHRLVALKRLPESVASDPDARQRFLDEARAAAGLNHPNVVTVYDAGVEMGLPYLAMELVDGTALNRLLEEKGPLPPVQALEACAAVALALDHAHRAGIVHRDVKPGNILVSREGRVKLTDFGIAALLSRGDNVGVAGTPYFMSPEQVRGDAVDGRADTYALGCVLFALLTGKPPFHGGDVLKGHLERPPPSLAAARPGLPVELDRLMAGCLAKDPAQRFPTAGEAAQAFSGFAAWIRAQTPGSP